MYLNVNVWESFFYHTFIFNYVHEKWAQQNHIG